jgi:4,5-dihydroxyphthalate decarboxylase
MQRPIRGVPVVLMQQSAYGMLMVRQDSPLKAAKDLEGHTIGVRAYTQTTGTWLRGMLHDQFDVDLTSLSWVTFEAAHVNGYEDPPNSVRAPTEKTLAQMLRDGAVDAAAGLEPADHPDLRTLLPNALDVEQDFIRQTGITPINHTMVVREDLAVANPWLVDELARMVHQSKAIAGSGPADGLERNRGALNLLARYAVEQQIISSVIPPEELYPNG